METSLYSEGEADKTQQLKRSMFLDFGSGNSKQQKLTSLLASPDLNMLKLASPELEKMLLGANGMMTTTPTPTSFVYPKYVTDEQEAYARGFVEALAQLHQPSSGAPGMNGDLLTPIMGPNISETETSIGNSMPTSTYSTLMPMSMANPAVTSFSTTSAATTLANMSNMNPSPRKHPFIPSSLAASTKQPVSTIPGPSAGLTINVSGAPAVKEEPLPSTSYSDHRSASLAPSHSPAPSSRLTDSPALSPGSNTFDNNNFEDGFPLGSEKQEEIKVERKRARNRIAARKCRTRKLERIARLEEKVNELKSKNNELAQTATSLNEQVMQLKQQIMDHMKTGCTVMMPSLQNLPGMSH